MKLIIAGGRDYRLTKDDLAKLDAIEGVTEVVSGMCGGADLDGKAWADSKGIPVKPFPALWNDLSVPGAVIRRRRDGTLYNAAAGPQRNHRMAQYAEACALFPGGSGTKSMYDEAVNAGLRIFDFRTDPGPQRGPSSVRQIEAQIKQVRRELF